MLGVRLSLAALAVALLGGAARGAADDLQARIAAAEPGATLTVDAGVYGPIVVDKPLTLIGREGATIDGGGTGDVVILATHDAVFRGFTIRNSGDNLDRENAGVRVLGDRTTVEGNRMEDVLFGVDLKGADDCAIRDNYISSKPLDIARRGDAVRLYRSNRCVIEGNLIENGRDALLWYSNGVVVRGNTSRHNRYGFHLMYANDVTLEDNDLHGNSVGIYIMYGRNFEIRRNRLVKNRGPSGYGLGLKEIDRYTIEANVFAGNRVGLYMDGSPYTRRAGAAELTRNAFAFNDVGIAMLPAVKGNLIVENDFVDNIEQVALLGRGSVKGNTFARDGRGNHWSDYGGFDADHDGVGDQPYAARKLFESLIDHEPNLRLMLFSPAHEAIEFIGRAVPAVRPEPKFEDPSPLMRPVRGAHALDAPPQAAPLALLAASLAAVAAAVVVGAFGWRVHRERRGAIGTLACGATR